MIIKKLANLIINKHREVASQPMASNFYPPPLYSLNFLTPPFCPKAWKRESNTKTCSRWLATNGKTQINSKENKP